MKPLEVEDASPCMKCGSVQCAFCSLDLKEAFEGFHKEIGEYIDEEGKVRWLKYYATLKKWFPVVAKRD